MTDIETQVEHDTERAAKLMRGLMQSCYEASEEWDQESFRLDTLGVVGVVTWVDEDGHDREDIICAFESKKHYIKVGILTDVLNVLNQRTGGG